MQQPIEQNWSSERDFLARFKTRQCTNTILHDPNNCSFYHNYLDIRKNPYSIKNQIIYLPEMCINNQQHDWNKCNKCHNNYELSFHPLRYRTEICNRFYDCNTTFCPHNHQNSPFTDQFFRFDINTFKVYKCQIQYPHQKKICLFYHNSKDRRRKEFQIYQHVECRFQSCKKGDTCQYSHNKIQQLFHPSRYKSKFCQDFLNKLPCQYGQFCSFAHSNAEITIKLIGQMERTPDFQQFLYKTIWCPLTIEHNRAQCVYAHNIQDFRRDPKIYDYNPTKCKNWKINDKIKSLQEAGCAAGMQCKFCHGWKQFDYHPANYMRRQNQHQQVIPSQNLHQQRRGSCKLDQEVIKIKLGKQSHKNVTNKWDKIIDGHLKPKNNKNSLFTVGVPFFKTSETTSSYGSKTTKAKSEQYHSGSQNDKYSQVEERGSINNSPIDFRNQKPDSWSGMDRNSQLSDYQIFKCKEGQFSQKYCSKSCDKQDYSIHYSQDIHNLLEYKIIDKLKKARISQIKLLNLKQEQILTLTCLTPNQRNQLNEKLKSLNEFKTQKVIRYSNHLRNIFKAYHHEQILQKMNNKKVYELKLLYLQQKQIKDLSFLTQEEKKDLPNILKQISNQRQFASLHQEIKTSIL